MGKQPILKLLIFSLLYIPFSGSSQEWKEIRSIDLPQTPSSFSEDIQGNIYIGYQNGKMMKYDVQGNELENYSLNNLSSIDLIDAQNSLRIFLFLYDIQQISILDRFSSVPKNYGLDALNISFGMMACPSPDNNFWVVENNPQRLSKIDPLRQSKLIEVQTQLGDSITFMRAYQNLLLISDENELHIFDQYGTKLNGIKGLSPRFFQFNEDLVLAFDDSQVYEIEIFNASILNSYQAPISKAIGVVVHRDQYTFITNERILVYSMSK